MTNVSRSDVYVRDEKGPSWFEEFLETLANKKSDTTQDILNSIYNVRARTVDSVVNEYRKQVGLDLVTGTEESDETIKQASTRPLSVRHASELRKSPMDIVMNSEEIQNIIKSFCVNSGGHKGTTSIISKIRQHLEDAGVTEKVFTNEELKKYIEECKDANKQNSTDKVLDPGMVGTDSNEEYADTVADYATYDGAQ
jgi:hypothetical protein